MGMISQFLIVMPMPIYIHRDGGAPVTPEQIKVFIGIFIVLNAIWAVALIIEVIRFLKFKKSKFHEYSYHEFLFGSIMMNILMIMAWGVILLIYAGITVAKYL